jgi:hypothetical protein
MALEETLQYFGNEAYIHAISKLEDREELISYLKLEAEDTLSLGSAIHVSNSGKVVLEAFDRFILSRYPRKNIKSKIEDRRPTGFRGQYVGENWDRYPIPENLEDVTKFKKELEADIRKNEKCKGLPTKEFMDKLWYSLEDHLLHLDCELGYQIMIAEDCGIENIGIEGMAEFARARFGSVIPIITVQKLKEVMMRYLEPALIEAGYANQKSSDHNQIG